MSEQQGNTPSMTDLHYPQAGTGEKPDSAALKLLLQILLQAKKTNAPRVHVGSSNGSLRISFLIEKDDPENPAVVHTMTADPRLLSGICRNINERAFYWPDPGDELFISNASRTKRLMLAPASDFRLCGDLPLQQMPQHRDELIVLENIVYKDIQPLAKTLPLSNSHKDFLTNSLKQKHGIVLANSAPKEGSIDGSALVLSMRPDALFYKYASSSDLLADAASKAKNHLVILSSNKNDPVAAICYFLALLQNFPETRQAFISRLLLSCIHRQARRVCSECAKDTPVTPQTLEGIPATLRPLSGKTYLFGRGCDTCGHSAYRGAVGIDSIVSVDEQLQTLLEEGAEDTQIAEIAYRRGARSLLEDGLSKIYAGLTSFEEVLKLAKNLSPAFEAAIVSHTSAEAETPLDSQINKQLNSLGDEFFASKDSAPELSPITLLVVEDDDDQREILELLFRTEGYEVLGADNGKKALETLQSRPVDLIVCDIMMPIMNGADLIKEIRKTPGLKHIPVLMLTAMSNPDAEYKLLAQGADDYCQKTVQRKILLKRVERLLNRTKSNPVQHLLSD